METNSLVPRLLMLRDKCSLSNKLHPSPARFTPHRNEHLSPPSKTNIAFLYSCVCTLPVHRPLQTDSHLRCSSPVQPQRSTMAPPPQKKAGPVPAARLHRFASLAGSMLFSFLRMLLGLLLVALASPLLAPALAWRLPPCAVARLLERLAARTLALIASLAGVQVALGAPCETLHCTDPAWNWLSAPFVLRWHSPLPHNHSVLTYDQPGRWMTDTQLSTLVDELASIAVDSIDAPLAHRLFDESNARAAFSNRVVSVAYNAKGTPVGFTALVYIPFEGSFLIHLGLTMIRRSARGRRLQGKLFTKVLALATLNRWRFAYPVTNIAASPAGIGNVADYFDDVFPHYAGIIARQPAHLQMARHVLGHYRHEFGCSALATFNEETFVVRGSNQKDGGGSAAFIKRDGKPVSQHRHPTCNAFCTERLDFAKGDELLQVGRFNVMSSIAKYVRVGRFFVGRKAK